MTRKLYYDDPLKREFDAVVLDVVETVDGADAVLDCTCFYPEGGGQPADRGFLDDIPVFDVRKDGERVIHRLTKAPVADTVHGWIDWNHRFDYMQQHTGQHIISAAMIHVGGYNTVAVHQGDSYTTVECDSGQIPDSELAAIEELANLTVGRNLRVYAFDADESRIPELQLRRPPKVTGTIRIVEIDDFDRVACGGVHTPSTGEVGLIKLVGAERIRGNLRTVWKIGRRALDDYREKTAIVNALIDRFSARQHEIVERAAKLEESVRQAQYNERSMMTRLSQLWGAQLHAASPRRRGIAVVTQRFDDEPGELVRGVLEALIAENDTCACLVNVQPDRVQWTIGCSEALRLDFDAVRRDLLPLISGKGGGRPRIWQGVGSAVEGADRFLAQFGSAVEALLERA